MKIIRCSFLIVLCAGLLPFFLSGCNSSSNDGPSDSPSCSFPLKATVGIEGPGGHSNGAFGNTSALHAAGNAAAGMLDGSSALPENITISINNFTGGNSVNSIAYNADFTVEACAGSEENINTLKTFIANQVNDGISAENAFRGVEAGQTNPSNGNRMDVRLVASGIVFE